MSGIIILFAFSVSLVIRAVETKLSPDKEVSLGSDYNVVETLAEADKPATV